MSDDESDWSDVDSFSSIQNDLEQMSSLIEDLSTAIYTLEHQMTTMHRPMESLHLDQLGSVPFLESSPFRHETFAVQPPGFPGVDLTKRYTFHEICATLRNFLIQSRSVQTDGTIVLPSSLQHLFGMKESHTTYVDLLGHLRRVLV